MAGKIEETREEMPRTPLNRGRSCGGTEGGRSMTREDYIRSLIKSSGCNLKEFAAQIHMPYTTLLSILNGSIGGAAMDNVLKICRALDMTVEELDNALAKPLPAHTPGEGGIDPNLLALIRKLPAEKQRALKLLLTET